MLAVWCRCEEGLPRSLCHGARDHVILGENGLLQSDHGILGENGLLQSDHGILGERAPLILASGKQG